MESTGPRLIKKLRRFVFHRDINREVVSFSFDKQYCSGIAYRMRMNWKSISKQLDPTASLATFVSLGLGVAAVIDFDDFISMLLGNWILIAASIFVGIFVVRPLLRNLFSVIKTALKELLKNQELESKILDLEQKILQHQDGIEGLLDMVNNSSDAEIQRVTLDCAKDIRQFLRDKEYVFGDRLSADKEHLRNLSLLLKSQLIKRVENSSNFLEIAYYAAFESTSEMERIANDIEKMANSLNISN